MARWRQVRGPFQRTDRGGWWLEYSDYVNGRRIQRRLKYPTKGTAAKARTHLEQKLNASRLAGMALPWAQAVTEYLARFRREGLADNTFYEAEKTLRYFERICYPRSTTDLNQQTIDRYTDERREALNSMVTLQKDLAKLRTFARWLHSRGWHDENIQWPKIRVDRKNRHALTTQEIRTLIAACTTQTWRMRVILSLTTGLRKTDVDALRVSAIDWQAGTISTRSKKTRKAMERRPLPDALLPQLRAYVDTLSGDAILPGGNSQIRAEWEALRARAGMSDLTRQDLRATFSTWMQRIAMDNPATRLLEHSSPVTTQTYYTDQELLDKLRVNLLPVEDWLSA